MEYDKIMIITSIIVFLCTIGFVLGYELQEDKLLMDEFCENASGIRMTEYKRNWVTTYIKFKCEGRGDTIFESKFKKCKQDEWQETKCENMKPQKSVLKNLLR